MSPDDMKALEASENGGFFVFTSNKQKQKQTRKLHYVRLRCATVIRTVSVVLFSLILLESIGGKSQP